MTEQHSAFLAHWYHLIALEGKGSLKYQKEIWCMDAYEREKLRRCLSHMVIQSGSPENKLYVFSRHTSHPAVAHVSVHGGEGKEGLYSIQDVIRDTACGRFRFIQYLPALGTLNLLNMPGRYGVLLFVRNDNASLFSSFQPSKDDEVPLCDVAFHTGDMVAISTMVRLHSTYIRFLCIMLDKRLAWFYVYMGLRQHSTKPMCRCYTWSLHDSRR